MYVRRQSGTGFSALRGSYGVLRSWQAFAVAQPHRFAMLWWPPRTTAVFPLTTEDPASELAMKLDTITEAIRMARGLDYATTHPEIVAALIHASAIADLAEAIRGAAADIGGGLDQVASQIH